MSGTTIHTAPDSELTNRDIQAELTGHTLPALLDTACEQYPADPVLFYLATGAESNVWQACSQRQFRQRAEQLALRLRQRLDFGARVLLLMRSDFTFTVVDMACLIAGLVDVPLYANDALDNIRFIVSQTAAKILFVSDIASLQHVNTVLTSAASIETVVITDPVSQDDLRTASAQHPALQMLTLDELLSEPEDQATATPVATLKSAVKPQTLATIIYTSGTTGQPKGVMLTHQNLTAAALGGMSTVAEVPRGASESTLLFLPLVHVMGRALFYGHLHYGHQVYFSQPQDLLKHLADVRPTLLATAPRLFELIYDRIEKKRRQMRGIMRRLLDWSLNLARRYDTETGLGYRLQHALAQRLIFTKWRAAFGGRLKFIICGGAALNTELETIFSAAGLNILQAYGLTETSSGVSFCRDGNRRRGTLGKPAHGVDIMLAEDGEILVRGPQVTAGYYQNEAATQAAIDEQGWFHTGDLGSFSADGFLSFVDRKKHLFKLSNGEYVIPQPIEHKIQNNPLITMAVVVGSEKKSCGAILFVQLDNLTEWAASQGIEAQDDALCQHHAVRAYYQAWLDTINQSLAAREKVRKYHLSTLVPSLENGLLTPTMKLKRHVVNRMFEDDINLMLGK